MRKRILTALGLFAIATTFVVCVNIPADDAISVTDGEVREEGQPICKDWEKPAFALFITGRQYGYIEPCGCTGLEFQKGGLSRRQTLYRDLKSKGWDLIPVDIGNQVRRIGPQAAIKFQTTMTALREMEYSAVGLGPDDLRLDSGELLVEVAGNEPTPLVSSNVSVIGFPVGEGAKIVKAGKYKVGITSVLGEEEQRGIRSADLQFTRPADAIKKAHARFMKAGCDVMVLLAYASTEETITMATSSKEAKDFRIVITAGGADEPALKPQQIPNTRSFMIQTGKKGMHVGVLGIYPNAPQPIRYERVALDKRFRDSPEMLRSLATYQDRLKDIYRDDWTRLVLRPVVHPSTHRYVGSEACKECHEHAYEVWENSPHHEATHSIAFPTERSAIPRNFDPECLSCHVTGWNPQDYFPYVSGYKDFEVSKHLHGNGCENCHGPGSAHVAAEKGVGNPDAAKLKSLREAVRLPLDKAEDHCRSCHDLDNDPDFQKEGAFDEYWAEIEHYD